MADTVTAETHYIYCLVAHGDAVRDLSNDSQVGERLGASIGWEDMA